MPTYRKWQEGVVPLLSTALGVGLWSPWTTALGCWPATQPQGFPWQALSIPVKNKPTSRVPAVGQGQRSTVWGVSSPCFATC